MIMVRKKEISPQYRRKTTMEVTILQVVSPSHFVVRETPHIAMSKEAHEFLVMEKRLNQYYDLRGVVYSVMPERNAIVAVLPEGDKKWFRAQVLCVMESTNGPIVNCFLLDYGGTRLIRRERMYGIAEEFLSVPFQAVDFILLGIKPKTMHIDHLLNVTYGPAEKWDSASDGYIHSLCETLDAAFIEILGYDSDGCIHGNLHVEQNSCKFILNEALVSQGYAVMHETACQSVLKFDAIEIDTVESESSVCTSRASTPQVYTVENYLTEPSVESRKLNMEDLKSLREALKDQIGKPEVEFQESTSASPQSPEDRPKSRLSKQYLSVKAVLTKNRPCIKEVQPKDAKTSSHVNTNYENTDSPKGSPNNSNTSGPSPNGGTDNNNSSVTSPKVMPPSSILQRRVHSLFKRKLALSKLTSPETPTAAQPRFSTISRTLAEKSPDNDQSPDTSFSSCSLPVFTTDDESANRSPSTPFPAARCDHSSGVSSHLNNSSSLTPSSSAGTCHGSGKHNSLHSHGNYGRRCSISSVDSVDSTHRAVHNAPKVGPSENNSEVQNVGSRTSVCVSGSSASSPSTVCEVIPAKCSTQKTDYSSLRSKIFRVHKGHMCSSASKSPGSPLFTNVSSPHPAASQSLELHSGSGGDSPGKCENLSSHVREKNSSLDRATLSLHSSAVSHNVAQTSSQSSGTFRNSSPYLKSIEDEIDYLFNKSRELHPSTTSTSRLRDKHSTHNLSSQTDKLSPGKTTSTSLLLEKHSTCAQGNLSSQTDKLSPGKTTSASPLREKQEKHSARTQDKLSSQTDKLSPGKTTSTSPLREKQSTRAQDNLSAQTDKLTPGKTTSASPLLEKHSTRGQDNLCSPTDKLSPGKTTSASPLREKHSTRAQDNPSLPTGKLSPGKRSCVLSESIPSSTGLMQILPHQSEMVSYAKKFSLDCDKEIFKGNRFLHTEQETSSAEQDKPQPVETNSSSSGGEVTLNKDDHCYQDQPMPHQTNDRKVSVDELFSFCKNQGEELAALSAVVPHCTPASSKIVTNVYKTLKRGISRRKGGLKSSPSAPTSSGTTSDSKAKPEATESDQVGSVREPAAASEILPQTDREASVGDGSRGQGELGTESDSNSVKSDSQVNPKVVELNPVDILHETDAKTDEEASGDIGNGEKSELELGLTSVVTQNMSPESWCEAETLPAEPSTCNIKNVECVGQEQHLRENEKEKLIDLSEGEHSTLNLEKEERSGFDPCGDVQTVSGASSDTSEGSPEGGGSKHWESTHSVVQSLTQQIIDPRGISGQYFKTALDFSDKSLWESSAIPAVSIGECVPQPLLRTEEVPFTPLIRKRLDELRFWGPSCIQSVVWPAVFRNRSFAAIAPRASGKTIAYLLPILSMLVDGTKYQELPAGNGPLLLIFCPTWVKVAAVYEQCMNLLEGTSKVNVKVLYAGGGDKDKEVYLFNGCDVLISTPPSFLHYLRKKATNFERCSHIMLDDADNLNKQYKEEISSVMKDLLVYMKRHKRRSFSLQIGLCSERWTKGVASFVDTLLLKPLLFFTSFLEAAIYSHVPMYVHACSSKTVDFVLLGLLEGIICPKAIICTRDIDTAKHVQGVLQQNAMFSMLVHNDKPHYELTAIKRRWNAHVSRDSTFILIVTDDVLLSLNVRDANCVLHYDLPEVSRLTFSQRFGPFADYFSTKGDQKQQTYVCHVLITDQCKVQASALLKLLSRMGLQYPSQLLKLAHEQMEVSLNRLDAPLCHYMKAFGTCGDSRCSQRHLVTKELDSPFVVPKQGQIKALVTEVIDATHYYVKILEYVDCATLATTVVSAQYMKLFTQLKTYYDQASNKIVAGRVKEREVYAVEEASRVFSRVRVVEIISSSPNMSDTQKVKVFFLDDGGFKVKEASQLLVLPEELQAYPQMCVEAYLGKVKTVDSSNQWTPQANMLVSKLICGKEIHGKIALCLGETIWLDPLVLKEGPSVIILKLDRTLRHLGYALPNMEHLKLLRKACADKIDLPVESSPKKSMEILSSPAAVEYAFLEIGTYEDVYVNEVNTVQEFFIQRCKFFDCLEALEKEISIMHEKKKLKRCWSIHKGMCCIALFPDDEKLYRARVDELEEDKEADVGLFFVDYGDVAATRRSNLYVIPPKFLLLPFQAIECELAGIIAPQGGWSEDAGDLLFKHTRSENGDLKILRAQVFQKASGSKGGNLYSVQLFDDSLNIGEHLVEKGLAVASELPEFPELPADEKHPVVDLDDIPSGYISAASDDSMLSNEKDSAALFWAALCGVYTPPKPTAPPGAAGETTCICPADSAEVVEEVPVQARPTDQQVNQLNLNSNLKPPIVWWDSPEDVFVSIKLVDVQAYELQPFIDGFSFSTKLGAKHYFVEETFFAEVVPEQTSVECHAQAVRVCFQKKESKKWPRLTQQTEKLFYISRDVDHIDTESESECERSKSADVFKVPKIPVRKEDIYYECTTTDDGSSSCDSDYDSSWWQRLSLPKEI